MLAFMLQVSETADIIRLFTWPAVILIVIIASALAFMGFAKRYVKVPPEKALVLSGRGGTLITTGGAKLVLPVLYEHYYLDLTAFEFPVDLKGVQDSNRVEISLKAIVVCKIPNDDNMIKTAAANFGQKDPDDIANLTQAAFEGHVRSAIGKMTVQEIISEREKLSSTIKSEAEPELAKLGVALVTLNIQEISDHAGYIKALGASETARVLAEAEIQKAEQIRRSTVETTTAQREAERIRADNEGKIADADRDLKMKQAQYAAQIQREQATAAQAGPLAAAEAKKAVVKAEVDVIREKTEAEIKLQDAVARKTEAELAATVLKQADAEKIRLKTEAEGRQVAATIVAEGNKQKTIIEADAAATATLKEAEARKQALALEGQGQAAKTTAAGNAAADVAERTGRASAAATEAQLLAEARGKEANAAAERAKLLAEAEGLERKLLAEAAGQKAAADALRERVLAEAAGVQAQLLAQAEGMEKLMAAYADLSPEQKDLLQLKWTLEALPSIVEKLGVAGEQIMGKIADTVTASLANIDNITVYDSGSGSNGLGAIERIAKVAPQTMLDMVKMIEATGTGPALSGVLNKLGIDIDGLLKSKSKSVGA